jgi:dCMP deaminase
MEDYIKMNKWLCAATGFRAPCCFKTARVLSGGRATVIAPDWVRAARGDVVCIDCHQALTYEQLEFEYDHEEHHHQFVKAPVKGKVEDFCSDCGELKPTVNDEPLAKPGLRPDWDEIWMEMAYNIRRRSYDPRLQVGCVIVPDDNSQILALGYNGQPKGLPNIVDSLEPGKSGMIHAEQNAMYKLDYREPSRKVMYLTHSPCDMCAKGIIQCKIAEVVYDVKYRSEEGLRILSQAGVETRQYSRLTDR